MIKESTFIYMSAIDKQWHLVQDSIVMNTFFSYLGDPLENIWETYNSVSVVQQQVLLSHINLLIDSVISFKDMKKSQNNN